MSDSNNSSSINLKLNSRFSPDPYYHQSSSAQNSNLNLNYQSLTNSNKPVQNDYQHFNYNVQGYQSHKQGSMQQRKRPSALYQSTHLDVNEKNTERNNLLYGQEFDPQRRNSNTDFENKSQNSYYLASNSQQLALSNQSYSQQKPVQQSHQNMGKSHFSLKFQNQNNPQQTRNLNNSNLNQFLSASSQEQLSYRVRRSIFKNSVDPQYEQLLKSLIKQEYLDMIEDLSNQEQISTEEAFDRLLINQRDFLIENAPQNLSSRRSSYQIGNSSSLFSSPKQSFAGVGGNIVVNPIRDNVLRNYQNSELTILIIYQQNKDLIKTFIAAPIKISKISFSFKLELNIEKDSSEIKIELYDASEIDISKSMHEKTNQSMLTEEDLNDESKICYTMIGYIKVTIDEVLKHVICQQSNNFSSLKTIYQEQDQSEILNQNGEIVISNQTSNAGHEDMLSQTSKIQQTTGKVKVGAQAYLSNQMIKRLQKIQQNQKLKFLERFRDAQKNLKDKEQKVICAIQQLQTVSFQIDQGIVINQMGILDSLERQENYQMQDFNEQFDSLITDKDREQNKQFQQQQQQQLILKDFFSQNETIKEEEFEATKTESQHNSIHKYGRGTSFNPNDFNNNSPTHFLKAENSNFKNSLREDSLYILSNNTNSAKKFDINRNSYGSRQSSIKLIQPQLSSEHLNIISERPTQIDKNKQRRERKSVQFLKATPNSQQKNDKTNQNSEIASNLEQYESNYAIVRKSKPTDAIPEEQIKLFGIQYNTDQGSQQRRGCADCAACNIF
eukprot:403353196